jgi:GNAT superfamily N-acetyltransferase
MHHIIDATFEDLPAILKLQKLCYSENARRYNNDQITPLIQTQQEIENEFSISLFLKAINGSSIIGSIRAEERDNTCFIGRIFVHPDYQNRGIGTRLMHSVEKRYAHLSRFELFTGFKDKKNIRLYKKLGYSIFKETKRHDGIIFYFMEKDNHNSKL